VEEVTAKLSQGNIAHGSVNNIPQVFEQFPWLQTGRFVRHPVKYSATPCETYNDPPTPGQHNDEISELLASLKSKV
jgi:crotonobetainyl-CoA:carnitine CoA-transferase CaiB-like acyl-CoA transferase